MSKSNWIGQKVSNRYLIEEMLGQGGMSAVYKATDPNLRRVVAVKMIHTHLSDNPDFVQRFEEEAAAVAQLRHPGIIQVYDFNKDEDVYYMVLEFVPGETIQDRLKRLNADGRKLPIDKAVEYMASICDAVDYAHQRGMIHRDIKPANLMINTQDQAILMDFGIAKIVGGQRHTATGAVVGTAMYMSPEQIRGERPDRRTDIYSLGVTLFEMVGGRPPFQADSAMTLMMMHINDPVPDPKKLNPEVPDDLVAVINKALAKDPNQRYQTAAEMATALRKVLARIRSGAPLERPVSSATMLEASPNIPTGPQATLYEPPSARPQGGTVVESAPLPTRSTPVRSTGVGGTMVEGTGSRSIPQSAPVAPPPDRSKMTIPLIAGGAIVLLCVFAVGIFIVSKLLGGTASAAPTEVPAIVINTDIPTLPVIEITATPAAATDVPTDTAVPATPTPTGPYVVITNISIQDNYYVVDYEVHNNESTPNIHVHMFYNTVPPDQAGAPGSGPWKLTFGSYGPSPFTQYSVSSRPANATQMCSLIANPNHTVIPNSGNCVDLP